MKSSCELIDFCQSQFLKLHEHAVRRSINLGVGKDTKNTRKLEKKVITRRLDRVRFTCLNTQFWEMICRQAFQGRTKLLR